jgi:8-oxo-dGTP pyrophosphatase MutT (NUDIX family)
MKRFVLTFLFDPTLTKVVMIKKTRPDFMAGLLNAPGGHVEEGETDAGAAEREFLEETGLEISRFFWKPFLDFTRNDARHLTCYWWVSHQITKVNSVTDEQVVICDMQSLFSRSDDIVKDTLWILAMAHEAINRHDKGDDLFLFANDPNPESQWQKLE